MKVVPARWIALGLAFLFCAGPLILGWRLPRAAAADDLTVRAEAVSLETGLIELRISWHWAAAPGWRWGSTGEDLLAVAFDTQTLVFDSEDAPLGAGADGDTLRRLDSIAGPDGARRHFVIPEGQDGAVQLRFRSVREGVTPGSNPFKVFVVFRAPSDEVWFKETELSVESL